MPRPPSGLPRRQAPSDPSLGLVIVGRQLAVLVKACGCVLIAVSFRMRRLVGNTQTDGIGKHEGEHASISPIGQTLGADKSCLGASHPLSELILLAGTSRVQCLFYRFQVTLRTKSA